MKIISSITEGYSGGGGGGCGCGLQCVDLDSTSTSTVGRPASPLKKRADHTKSK